MGSAPLQHTRVPQLWRGSVLARGYCIDPTLPDARHRVIERWTPGAELRAVPGDDGAPGGWLLLVAAPERVLTPPPGLVVVEKGGGLSALSNVAAGPGEVVLPARGVTRRFELAKLDPVDPSAWFTLDLEVVATTALGPPPAPPQPPRVATTRTVLGRPELSPEQRALLVSLREPPPPPPPPNMAARLAWLVGLVPRHSEDDRLPAFHSSSGRSDRGTSTRMLRAAPAVRAISPRCSSSTIIRWTDGGASPKKRAMSVSAGGCLLTLV